MNANDIYEAIKRRHPLPEWVLIRELRLGTGFRHMRDEDYDYSKPHWRRNKALQRIDAWALNCYPGQNYKKIAYEIKVSRSDFFHEKRDPDKKRPAMEVSDYFYFAVPRGLVAPMEVPKACGLLVVYESGRSEILKRAPLLEATRLDWRFVASLGRSIHKMRRTELPTDRFEPGEVR